MPCKKYRQCLEQIRNWARGRGMSFKNYRQYLKQATRKSGAKGVEDSCPKHTPLFFVQDVELDTSSFFEGLLRDRRCLYANS